VYKLHQKVSSVRGVGDVIGGNLAERDIVTIQDLLLWTPLRYEDRSERYTIALAPKNELLTLQLRVVNSSGYRKGRRLIHRATFSDNTGRINAIWFNNRFIGQQLHVGQEYLVSGKISDRGQLVQPTVEKVAGESIHTDRLVPIYSAIPDVKTGKLRRIMKEVIDNLEIAEEENVADHLSLVETFRQIHFPDEDEKVIAARQRLALEE